MPVPISQDHTLHFFADPCLPLAVVVANTRWDEPPRMRHDVTRQLIRFCNVVFVEFFPAGERGDRKHEWVSVSERLIILSPTDRFRVPPRLRANIPWVHARCNMHYAREIQEAVRGISCNTRILFNFVYDFREITQLPDFDWSCYICFDEFPRMQRRAYRRNYIKSKYHEWLFQRYENDVARGSSCCLTPHFPLRDKLTEVNGQVHMFHHAHNFPNSLMDIPRRSSGKIHVGFAGYINYRILLDWLVELMKDPAIVLHLIGPKDGPELEKLNDFPNLQRVPPLAGKAYFDKLLEMDVLIMPYDPSIPEVNILTTNSKFFQCIATTRPLVISDLPHYMKMPPGVIYRASNQREFVEKVRLAYCEDSDDLRKLRSDIAAENTWDKRGEQLHGYLKEALGDRIPEL